MDEKLCTLFIRNNTFVDSFIIKTFLLGELQKITNKNTAIYKVENLLNNKKCKFSIYINFDILYPYKEDKNSIIEFRVSHVNDRIDKEFKSIYRGNIKEYIENYKNIDLNISSYIENYIKYC